jgi:hypothetical protein
MNGMSPAAQITRFTLLRQMLDTELLIKTVASGFLWAVWLYGLISVVTQFITFKRYGSIQQSDRLFRKTTATFVVALWLFSSQGSSKSSGQIKNFKNSAVEVLVTEKEHQRSEQSLAPSGFAMASLLSLFESSQRRKLQLSSRGMYEQPLSAELRMYLMQLRYRTLGQPSEMGVSEIPARLESVAATNTNIGEESEDLESGNNRSIVLTIPIGSAGEKPVLLPIREHEQISIHSNDETTAQAFAQYLNCFLSASTVSNKSVQFGSAATSDINISGHDGQWKIEPGGVAFTPFVFRKQEAKSLLFLQRELSRPLVEVPAVRELDKIANWKICVRIMGPVEVADRSWDALRFEKSKSTELLTWLVTHRERPTRIAARTALWEMSIENSTFNNVVSGVRKAINQNGNNLLERESNDVLKVGAEVITDVQILEAAIDRVKNKGADEDFIMLRDALGLVRDLPFAGEDYVWADTEGITSNVVLTVITGALMLSDFYLSRQDLNGVFWATGQGLKALRGHEELIALRMKAHAQQRNISGINSEWLAYERVRIADDRFLDREHNEIAKLRDSLLASV